MTPVVGFVADIANAGISVARGNYADASINLAAAVPGAGQAVMGAKMAAVGFGVYKSAKFAKGAGSSFSGVGNTTKALPAPKVRGNPNTATTYEKIVIDSKGNAIPLKRGESLTGSPDGRFIQVRDTNGNPTGLRIDGPHKPASHPDPRAQAPHAHVPGVTNTDGTPWLPVNQ